VITDSALYPCHEIIVGETGQRVAQYRSYFSAVVIDYLREFSVDPVIELPSIIVIVGKSFCESINGLFDINSY
jgi:hypothetical protein